MESELNSNLIKKLLVKKEIVKFHEQNYSSKLLKIEC